MFYQETENFRQPSTKAARQTGFNEQVKSFEQPKGNKGRLPKREAQF